MSSSGATRLARPRRSLGPRPAAPRQSAHADEPTPGSGADLTPEADPESVARAMVLRKLTAAPRTRAQLAGDLRERRVPDDVAVRVLDRFTEVGLVDDLAYAQAWVRSRHAGRGLSRFALRAELRDRGLSDEAIEQAIAQIGVGDEERAAAELVAKRLPSMRRLTAEQRTRRLVGMLARKGYPAGLAAAVVRVAVHDPRSPAALDDGLSEAGIEDEG